MDDKMSTTLNLSAAEECAWCGAPELTCRNRRGEAFCSKSHRAASGRGLRRFELALSQPLKKE